MEELPIRPLAALRERRSAKWRRFPADVLPLTVAELDVDPAPGVTRALRDAVDAGDLGYSAAEPELGAAVAGFAAARWGWDVDPGAVTAVADVGVGVVELLRVLTRPGDTVVVSPPVYPPFLGWPAEARARLREVPLARDGDRWRLDLTALEDAFRAGPAAYVLCNPHNPVGRVHTPDELAALVALARRYGVVLVSDEIHAPLVLPGARHTPLLSLPGAAGVAVALVSASKAFNLAGLKCAAVVTAGPALAEVVARFPPDVRWRTGHLGVIATVAALTAGGDWLDALLHTLDRRRAQLGELLAGRLPAVRWQPPEATYLAWLDCAALGGGAAARDAFLQRGRVAVEPGPAFGATGADFVRLNFGTSAPILDEATTRMARAAG